MGEKRGVYRVLVGKPEGKRPLVRPRRRWEDNILLFFFRRYNFNSLKVLAFSTYNFQFLRSWMQLVQLFIFSFLCHSLCHLPICSLVSQLVFLIGGIILGWIFRKWDVGLWTGLSWLRIGAGGGHL
jgi:hypothetical protein